MRQIPAILIAGMLAIGVTGCGGSDETPPAPTVAAATHDKAPDPPRIPDDFTWTGRYIVPDLDVEVPFTWHGKGGDFQMIAGGDHHPIHFTNVISDGQLYTLTYRWPGVPRRPCSHVGAFTVEALNAGFAKASFAGRETLHGRTTREVHHFRSVGVIDIPPGLVPDGDDDVQLRLPLMSGDIYVDVDDPTKIWQLLHFGVQNLYDKNLDEWIVIDEIDDAPGTVKRPKECRPSR